MSRLAFQRIRELQSAVEDARLDVGAREERIAQLERQVAALSKAAAAAQVGAGNSSAGWLIQVIAHHWVQSNCRLHAGMSFLMSSLHKLDPAVCPSLTAAARPRRRRLSLPTASSGRAARGCRPLWSPTSPPTASCRIRSSA